MNTYIRRRDNLSRQPYCWLLAAALLACGPAWADCTVSAQSVVFGSYDVFSPTPLDGVGRVDVSCDPSASYTVALSSGGGSYSQRQMANGGTLMNYNLYTGVSRTTVWGDGTSGSATVAGSGLAASHNVYGRIPAQQNLIEGSYTDVIIVTLTF